MKTLPSLALLTAFIITIAPCRADRDVAVSRLPRPVLKAVEARYPSGHIFKAEWDHEGYYEIKVQDGHTHHLLHVRPKGRVLKDEPDRPRSRSFVRSAVEIRFENPRVTSILSRHGAQYVTDGSRTASLRFRPTIRT
jgi:hypothetical protein